MRSPLAHQMDPPARKWQGLPATDLTAGAFARWLQGEADLDEAAWASVLRHEGLWVDRRRWSGEAVAAGTLVTVYAFATEPGEVALTVAEILLDGPVVAVAKPAWLCTQGTRASARLSVETQVRALLSRPELVAAHRLDRETSGVLLFSPPGSPAAALHAQFRAGTVEKTYHAVVRTPLVEARRVEGPMIRIPHPHHSLFALAPEGTEGLASLTEVRPLDSRRVEARPHTGRTHQIRVHLAAIGHPIAGDTLYGGPWVPGAPDRTLLHAAHMRVRVEGRTLALAAPEPADFA